MNENELPGRPPVTPRNAHKSPGLQRSHTYSQHIRTDYYSLDPKVLLLELKDGNKSVSPAGLSGHPPNRFQELATLYCMVMIFFFPRSENRKGILTKRK